MKLPDNPDIEVVRIDGDYEKITTEIRYLGEPIAQINQDSGKDALEIELFTELGDPSFVVKFPLKDFLTALDLAKESLLDY